MQKLLPLIIYCCPESGQFYPVNQADLPDFFAAPEIVISHSAEDKGWARVLATNFKVWRDTDQEKLLLRLANYDLLLVYPLSLNTLAKFALGIHDSFPTSVLYRAAETGIPVLLNQSFIPGDEDRMNAHLLRVYRRHWQDVQSGTISGFTLDTLAEAAGKILRNKYAADNSINIKSSRDTITRDDVIAAAEAMMPIKTSRNAIITDLAKEEAQARNIAIIIE